LSCIFSTATGGDSSATIIGGGNKCITIIDIESQKVMTTIPMDTGIAGMAVRGRTIYYCTNGEGLNAVVYDVVHQGR
jgi:hypothetical protein